MSELIRYKFNVDTGEVDEKKYSYTPADVTKQMWGTHISFHSREDSRAYEGGVDASKLDKLPKTLFAVTWCTIPNRQKVEERYKALLKADVEKAYQKYDKLKSAQDKIKF